VVGVVLVALTVAGLVVVSAQAPRESQHAVVVQPGDKPIVRAMRVLWRGRPHRGHGEGPGVGGTEARRRHKRRRGRGRLGGRTCREAGLKAGDVITAFDGERVRSARQLSRLVDETPVGRSVKMTLLRDGKPLTCRLHPTRSATRFMVGPEDLAIIANTSARW